LNPRLIAYQAVPPTQHAATPSDAAAPASASGGAPSFGSLGMFLIFLPVIALLFWQSRSQAKKQEAAVAGLKKGDRVVTQSGLIGRLVELDTRYARLELAPGVKVQVLRSSVTGRDAEDSAKTSDTEKSDKAKASDSDKSDKKE
jgi:preprotein translocase subunit YajC